MNRLTQRNLTFATPRSPRWLCASPPPRGEGLGVGGAAKGARP
jgi:hypothetical protein